MVRCRKCRVRIHPDRTARAVLRDPGKRGDGTGSLYIVMGWVTSMSDFAGPYCNPCSLARVNELNAPIVKATDDRDYPDGESNDARFQRWLVDKPTDPAIRPEGSSEVVMPGGELYGLLFDAVEWAYWNGTDDVRSHIA